MFTENSNSGFEACSAIILPNEPFLPSSKKQKLKLGSQTGKNNTVLLQAGKPAQWVKAFTAIMMTEGPLGHIQRKKH